jgi:hypothetical protein
MAKSQLRSNREHKKPKQPKKPATPVTPFGTAQDKMTPPAPTGKK